jgi:hypothetical protein
MAFRFIFWGDTSQNSSLVDSLAQQAENDFRNTYVDDFHTLNSTSANLLNPQTVNPIPPNQVSAPDSDSAKNAVVSELIQTVNKSLNTEIISNELSASGSVFADIKDSVSNSLDSISNSAVNPEVTVSAKADVVNQVNSLAESIKSVSKVVDEEINRQIISPAPDVTSDNQTLKSEMNQLLEKMKLFLDDLKNKVISLLDEIQKPQIEFYYGAEDAIKDADKKELINQNEKKQQEITEKKLLQKTLDTETKKQIKNTQMKLEKELKDQMIKKENQTELENLLIKRMEETRNKNLFGR